MKEYKLYFKFFNKKLRTTIKARNPEDAAHQLRQTIEIVKIVEANKQTPEPEDEDFLSDVFNSISDSISNFFKNKT